MRALALLGARPSILALAVLATTLFSALPAKAQTVTLTGTTGTSCNYQSVAIMPSGGVSNLIVTCANSTTPPATMFQLSVSVQGGGTITSNPSGINCGSAGGSGCAAQFLAGTAVTLTASPSSGNSLQSWGGSCTGNGACVVTVNSAVNISATFAPVPANTAKLNVSVGNGQGTITSTPAGISCPPTCSASFPLNTSVALSVAPASGYSLQSWGGACSGTGACSVTLTADTNVSANFAAVPTIALLTWSVTGNGIVSTDSGLDCIAGTPCKANFSIGSGVTLVAKPAIGYVLQSWGGACSGVAVVAGVPLLTCSIVMNANATVTTTFVAK